VGLVDADGSTAGVLTLDLGDDAEGASLGVDAMAGVVGFYEEQTAMAELSGGNAVGVPVHPIQGEG